MSERIITAVIARERGYVNHPADRGGPTKFGITAAVLGRWRKLGRAATSREVMDMQEPEARAIYEQLYITEPGLNKIRDPQLQELLVDCAVNSGPTRAVQWLQLALGVKADGHFGPVTHGAMAQQDSTLLFLRVMGQRMRFIGRLITTDPSQAAFAAGWANRMAEFLEHYTWDR